MVEKTTKVYEGKGKVLYETDSSDYLVIYFKDDTTAFNAAKRGTINQKGIVNNKISAKIFEFLESNGIPTHYEKILSDREMLVKRANMIPLEVIIRNVAAGTLCTALNLKEGKVLPCPVFEYCYKEDSLKDPPVNKTHIQALDLATKDEVDTIEQYTLKVNDLMKQFFARIGVDLIDFKLEFGRYKGAVILADEISPDTCRLWERGTGRKLDKDCFRKDLGNSEETYQEILSRVSA